jgi:hypothetical protein
MACRAPLTNVLAFLDAPDVDEPPTSFAEDCLAGGREPYPTSEAATQASTRSR